MLCSGEVGSKASAGRAPAAAKGEITRAPTGGCEVSVARVDPGGSPDAVPAAMDANVATISPCSRYAALAVIVATLWRRNSSAVFNAPGVPSAQPAPAVPSGQGG